MPLWVILLILSLCLTTVTGIYTLRQNGRNSHRNGNGNGNGHTVSQMTQTTEQSLSGAPPSQEKKIMTLSVPKIMEEEEATPEASPKWNQSKNNGSLPEEEPHDHSEDHSPDPVMRERCRLVRHPQEEEEENEDDELLHPESSSAPESLLATNKFMSVENGTQDEWRHDEDVVDTLITKKDGETQTTVFQEDKSIEAHPDMRDEEVQSSTVRENRTIQATPSIREMGTGEWLALQKSIGVGNHLETEEKGVGEHLETEDKAIGVRPEQEDKFIQEEPSNKSIGIGSPIPSLYSKGVQHFPDMEDESIQKDISKRSAGVQYIPRQSIDLLIEELEGSPRAKSIILSHKGSKKSEEDDNNPFGDNGSFHLSGVQTVKSELLKDEEISLPEIQSISPLSSIKSKKIEEEN